MSADHDPAYKFTFRYHKDAVGNQHRVAQSKLSVAQTDISPPSFTVQSGAYALHLSAFSPFNLKKPIYRVLLRFGSPIPIMFL